MSIPDTMRVAMYYANDDVRLESMPRPKPGPKEVLVKVEASGVCGSDVMQWYRAGKTPLVLGHEIAGTIVEVGASVTEYTPGQRISASHHVPCNACHYCSRDHHTVCDTLRSTKFYPGGFSEYLLLPEINVDRGIYVMPDSMTSEQGTFIEPLGCVLRGQKKAGVGPGSSVLVIGSGISGMLHIALAKARGASLVVSTDISAYRLDAAGRAGADAALDGVGDVASQFKELNGGRGADQVILTAGASSAINQAFEVVDRGGSILFFAPAREGESIELPVNKLFWKNEITLTSSYAANHAEHMEAMELISTGRVKVDHMITHRLPLASAEEGFRLVAEAGESIKVIILPQS